MALVRKLLIICMLAATPEMALAAICTASISDVAFGSISLRAGVSNQTTGNLSIGCSGANTNVVGVCVSIGGGTGGAAPNNSPRYLLQGSNRLAFGLRASGYGSSSAIWSSVFLEIPTVLGAGNVSVPIYADISSTNASVPVGNYNTLFSGAQGATMKYGVTSCAATGTTVIIPTFSVSGAVVSSCDLSVGDMSFGNISANIVSPLDAEAHATVRCSNSTNYTISLGLGGGVGVIEPARRKMLNELSVLEYGLYRNAARTLVWGDGAGQQVLSTGTGLDQSFTIFGRIHSGQIARTGIYTDSVLVTVEY